MGRFYLGPVYPLKLPSRLVAKGVSGVVDDAARLGRSSTRDIPEVMHFVPKINRLIQVW